MPNLQADDSKNISLHDAVSDIGVVLAEPDSKGWQELRDRAAYIFLSGSFPSHLRPHTVKALRQIVRIVKKPEGDKGSLIVTDEAVNALQLKEHPMVQTVERFTEKRYKIRLSEGPQDRRPFSRVLIYRQVGEGIQKATVGIDGSVKQGWH